MWRSIASNALTLFILALVALGALIGWGQSQYRSEGPLLRAVFFEVPRGASLRSVSDALEAQGAITDATLFRIGARYAEKADDLKFGNYEIPAGASMSEIVDIVTKGGPSTFRFVVNYIISNSGPRTRFRERVPGTGEIQVLAEFTPDEPIPEIYQAAVAAETPIIYRVAAAEGLTSWQILDGLRQADFLTGELPDVPPEGSLAPDTYEVRRGADLNGIVTRMTQAQERILAEAWENRAPDLPVQSPQEALILASIIEKETSVPDERGQVASVFTNRLRQEMRLQTDPTVIYGITRGEGSGLGRGIRASELRSPTPYNTYLIPGLPPTPIANPGKASIEAALNPDETPYIFFVADGTGGHAFSVTLAEHNANVRRWREIEAEREAAEN